MHGLIASRTSSNRFASIFGYGCIALRVAHCLFLFFAFSTLADLNCLFCGYTRRSPRCQGEKTPPMYGDYEAQRHWMELTLNLPARDWYVNTELNNLTYWGLDYPPLSAYASYVSALFIGTIDRNAVDLNTSRGFESPATRAGMRATVLISDLLLFFPALLLYMCCRGEQRFARAIVFCSFLPCLTLIDHAHFQYNSVSLALFLISVRLYIAHFDAAAAMFFCASIYFKQMGLYYALALFALHLSRVCVHYQKSSTFCALMYTFRVLACILMITVVTFWPWIGDVHLLRQLVQRLFPVSRGLYEDKVANVWCSLSIFFKLHLLLSRQQLLVLCSFATIVASLPFCAAIARRPSHQSILLGSGGCALAAYLFSYQVHEKQILIPTLPAAMLFDSHPHLSMWMSAAASFSLFPLLHREKLLLPFISLNAMHLIIAQTFHPPVSVHVQSRSRNYFPLRNTIRRVMRKLLGAMIATGCFLVLLVAYAAPPPNLPDLFVMCLTIYSCMVFCLLYLVSLFEIWTLE